jgi:hypothetical protein
MYRLIEDSKQEASVFLPWETNPAKQWLAPEELCEEVVKARQLLHADLVDRWVTRLPVERKTELAISTLLDPRYKHFDFVGATAELKQFAVDALATAWSASVFKPKPEPERQLAQPAALARASALPPSTVSASSILRHPVQSSALAPVPAASAASKPTVDELAKYLTMDGEPDPDVDVLSWWLAQDCELGLPNFAQLARQYLGTPASSAGVERLFSRAGRMHDDLRSAMDDGTLQHALFASQNTE